MRTWIVTYSWSNHIYKEPVWTQSSRPRSGCRFCSLHQLVGRAPGLPAAGEPGIAGFALAVCWFYFSDIIDKNGPLTGPIGLGVLFLAGGWALEKTRRGVLARMDQNIASQLVAL